METLGPVERAKESIVNVAACMSFPSPSDPALIWQTRYQKTGGVCLGSFDAWPRELWASTTGPFNDRQ